jgi:hypothetical protein
MKEGTYMPLDLLGTKLRSMKEFRGMDWINGTVLTMLTDALLLKHLVKLLLNKTNHESS